MIKIIAIEWFDDRQDWRVEYEDARNGLQRGCRFIALPKDANSEDLRAYIEEEGA